LKNSNIYFYVFIFRYVEHELTVGRIAKEVGFGHVSLSHEVMPMVKIVPRGYTACADAYLTPHIKKYIEVYYIDVIMKL